MFRPLFVESPDLNPIVNITYVTSGPPGSQVRSQIVTHEVEPEEILRLYKIAKSLEYTDSSDWAWAYLRDMLERLKRQTRKPKPKKPFYPPSPFL